MIPPLGPDDRLVQKALCNRLKKEKAGYYIRMAIFHTFLMILMIWDIQSKDYEIENYYDYCEAGGILLTALFVVSYLVAAFFKWIDLKPIAATKTQLYLLNDLHSTPIDPLNVSKSFHEDDESYNFFINHSQNSSRGSNPNVSPYQSYPKWSTFSLYPTPKNYAGNLTYRGYYADPYSSRNYQSRDDTITDEHEFQSYLRDLNRQQNSFIEDEVPHYRSKLAFWNYYDRTVNLLRTSVYQLAPSTTPPQKSRDQNKDEMDNFYEAYSNSDMLKSISSDKLSHYVTNLRCWISTTILVRLVKQIEALDVTLRIHGLHDFSIGCVGLERLRKTVENTQYVNTYFPMLPVLLPFLEFSANQEYLMRRLKDLASDTCMLAYKWNSGGDYNGVKWSTHLPSDAALIFHMFCVYMDTQLLPLPQGGGRPFYDRYVVVSDGKNSIRQTIESIKNKSNCAIMLTPSLQPKFNFISDGKINACGYNRNNLFYVLIQFLIYLQTDCNSSLEGVDMGRTRVNIMCCIEN